MNRLRKAQGCTGNQQNNNTKNRHRGSSLSSLAICLIEMRFPRIRVIRLRGATSQRAGIAPRGGERIHSYDCTAANKLSFSPNEIFTRSQLNVSPMVCSRRLPAKRFFELSVPQDRNPESARVTPVLICESNGHRFRI